MGQLKNELLKVMFSYSEYELKIYLKYVFNKETVLKGI